MNIFIDIIFLLKIFRLVNAKKQNKKFDIRSDSNENLSMIYNVDQSDINENEKNGNFFLMESNSFNDESKNKDNKIYNEGESESMHKSEYIISNAIELEKSNFHQKNKNIYKHDKRSKSDGILNILHLQNLKKDKKLRRLPYDEIKLKPRRGDKKAFTSRRHKLKKYKKNRVSRNNDMIAEKTGYKKFGSYPREIIQGYISKHRKGRGVHKIKKRVPSL